MRALRYTALYQSIPVLAGLGIVPLPTLDNVRFLLSQNDGKATPEVLQQAVEILQLLKVPPASCPHCKTEQYIVPKLDDPTDAQCCRCKKHWKFQEPT